MSYRYESVYFDDEPVPGRAVDFFLPGEVTRGTALFMVHGGGWRGGARGALHPLMRAFNREGYACAATDYRLAGVTILDQVTDVRHGYDRFVSYLKAKGRPVRIAVFGSSAGAHLAALLALARPGECAEAATFGECRLENDWTPPAGAALQAVPVTFEPWEDIFPHIWTTMQDIVGTPYADAPELYRKVSPIEYVCAASCSVFILDAENEHMFPHELSLEFVEKMKTAGARAECKVYTKAEHGFFYDVTRRQQKEAFADIVAFVESL